MIILKNNSQKSSQSTSLVIKLDVDSIIKEGIRRPNIKDAKKIEKRRHDHELFKKITGLFEVDAAEQKTSTEDIFNLILFVIT